LKFAVRLLHPKLNNTNVEQPIAVVTIVVLS